MGRQQATSKAAPRVTVLPPYGKNGHICRGTAETWLVAPSGAAFCRGTANGAFETTQTRLVPVRREQTATGGAPTSGAPVRGESRTRRPVPRENVGPKQLIALPAPVGRESDQARHPYDARVRLIDSHCHVNAERFADDAERVLETARASGVERILVPGWNVASCERARDLAGLVDWIDIAVGVHPHDAAKVDDAGWDRIKGWATDPRVKAIGETGLDYDRVFSPIPDQLTNLRRNLRLATETGKPAILHCRSSGGHRDAQDALLAELRALSGDRPAVVIHSFSGPVDYALGMLDLGAAISFSGLVFRKGQESSAEVARQTPQDRLLVETDSPFLAPPGAPKGRNEPEYVRLTATWVAEQRGAPLNDLVEAYDHAFRAS